MADKKFQINYGKGVTVFPSKAINKMQSGEATLDEMKILSVILASGGNVSATEIAEETDIAVQDVENAIAFWRGAGIITLKTSDGRTKGSETEKSDTPSVGSQGNEGANKETDSVGSDSLRSPAAKKALLSAEMPKYSGEEISALLSKDGGRLKNTVDECQQLIGHIFNPNETETVVGICDWLGVDSDFLITLTAYCTRKKPGCNVRYVQKTAVTLVNSGIDSIEQLDLYLKEMELYDGLAGKLRSWLGIGSRAFTKKENAAINHWLKDLGYGEELVKYAYDLTVEHKLSFNFDYANGILENWYKDGVKTVEDAEKREEEFKNGKKNEKEKPKESSFDTDEFFNLALKRSYEKMAAGKTKKEN